MAAVHLTDAQVEELRMRYAAGARQTALAAEYGIGQNTVSSIVTGKTRADAPGPIAAPRPPKAPRSESAPSARAQPLTVAQVADILAETAAGASRADLATRFGVSVWAIDAVRRGKTTGVDADGTGTFRAEDVQRMRTRYAAGASQSELAREFGTSQQMVSGIVRGEKYRSAGGPIVD